jgi:hypothetical protein
MAVYYNYGEELGKFTSKRIENGKENIYNLIIHNGVNCMFVCSYDVREYDDVKYDFSYTVSVFATGRYYCPTITLPFVVEAGNHVVEVKITGTGDDIGFYSDACSYVVGQGLTEVEVN